MDSLAEEKVEETDPKEQDDEAVETAGSIEEDETADQETEAAPAADEKIASTEKLSGIKKVLHPILSGIHKIAPGPLKR